MVWMEILCYRFNITSMMTWSLALMRRFFCLFFSPCEIFSLYGQISSAKVLSLTSSFSWFQSVNICKCSKFSFFLLSIYCILSGSVWPNKHQQGLHTEGLHTDPLLGQCDLAFQHLTRINNNKSLSSSFFEFILASMYSTQHLMVLQNKYLSFVYKCYVVSLS